MLESFIVAGRQDLDVRPSAHLRPVDHRRLPRLGANGGDPRPARRRGGGSPPGMRLAVLGVGPDRRLDRARREAAARRRGRGLRLRVPRTPSGRSSWGLSTVPPPRSPRRSRGPRSSSARRRSGRCRRWSPRRSAASGQDAVVTDVGSTKEALLAGLSGRAAASGSSAGTPWPAPRPPGWRTRAPTCSRARAGT